MSRRPSRDSSLRLARGACRVTLERQRKYRADTACTQATPSPGAEFLMASMARTIFRRTTLAWLGLVALCATTIASAESSPAFIAEDAGAVPLARQLAWRTDAPEDWSAQDAFDWFRANEPAHHSDAYPAMGFQPQPIWFYVPITNHSQQRAWLLEGGRAHMDYLDLFVFSDQGELIESIAHGNALPWSQRPHPSNRMVFPLILEPDARYHLVLRSQALGAIEMPLTLYTPARFQQHEARMQQFSGTYFGAILVMILFNVLLLIAIRDRAYFYYVLYLSSLALYLLSRQGLPFELFWPDSPEINNPLRAISGALSSAFGMLFGMHFLRMPTAHPWLAWTMRILAVAMSLLVPIALINVQFALKLATAMPGVLVFFGIGAAILRIREGFTPARFFLLSFSPMALLVLLFVLKTFSLIDSNWLLDHAIEIGSVMEAWLLSFALAYRFTMLKQDNERIQREATVELEHRVAERTRELNQALNARSEFLAVMSHEIRTPLNGILGTVDMLKDSKMDHEQQRKVHIIEQSGNSLLKLINDILDYSHIESGKLRIEEEHFNLPGLIRESIALFENKARINGNSTMLQLPDDLGTLCQGDPSRLRQILVNLISNAVKFTENGDITVRATRSEENRDYVTFEVEDTGLGIDAAYLPTLFEHFQQGDASTSRRHGGAGLGLAICRQLVELMGGEIGVRSLRGKGSCFWFRLPLARVSPENQKKNGEAQEPGQPLEAHRLLIVDDNHVNLLVAQGLARKLGHDVETAESGPEAIAVLLNDSRPFDLVLMDCEMPDMDGFETAREILRLQKEGRISPMPIVALTAHAVPDKIRACHEAGMVSHIAKPINSEKLDRELRAIFKPGREQP